jgi:hypothetical protein
MSCLGTWLVVAPFLKLESMRKAMVFGFQSLDGLGRNHVPSDQGRRAGGREAGERSRSYPDSKSQTSNRRHTRSNGVDVPNEKDAVARAAASGKPTFAKFESQARCRVNLRNRC